MNLEEAREPRMYTDKHLLRKYLAQSIFFTRKVNAWDFI